MTANQIVIPLMFVVALIVVIVAIVRRRRGDARAGPRTHMPHGPSDRTDRGAKARSAGSGHVSDQSGTGG